MLSALIWCSSRMHYKWQRTPAGATGRDLDQATAWGQSQSYGIALYARLADTSQTQSTRKCQKTAQRKLELKKKQKYQAVSQTNCWTHPHFHFEIFTLHTSQSFRLGDNYFYFVSNLVLKFRNLVFMLFICWILETHLQSSVHTHTRNRGKKKNQ